MAQTGYPSMAGKVCMVTGATSGIGRETSLALARAGAHVVLIGRDRARSEAVLDEIRSFGGDASYLIADLSSIEAVIGVAEAFKEKHDRLDVLVNNAGAVYLRRQGSVDGLEMTFALNHLSYFQLTLLLMDHLEESAPSRVVNVSSGSHYGVQLNFDDLQSERGYRFYQVYGRSKLANLYFTYELAARMEGTGVTVNAMNPGFTATNMGAREYWIVGVLRPLINRFGIPVEEGADTVVYLALSPQVEAVTGKYFYRRKPTRSSDVSYDAGAARRLWDMSAEILASAQRQP